MKIVGLPGNYDFVLNPRGTLYVQGSAVTAYTRPPRHHNTGRSRRCGLTGGREDMEGLGAGSLLHSLGSPNASAAAGARRTFTVSLDFPVAQNPAAGATIPINY